MSTSIHKVAIKLTIGGTEYPVQSASFTYPLNDFGRVALVIAPREGIRPKTAYKFSMSEILQQIDELTRAQEQELLAVVTMDYKNLSGEGSTYQPTGTYTMFRGYVGNSTMSAALGSLGISVNLVSELRRLKRGTTRCWALTGNWDGSTTPGTSDTTSPDVVMRFKNTCNRLHHYSIERMVGPLGKAAREELEIAMAMLATIPSYATKLKIPWANSADQVATDYLIVNSDRIWDALLNYMGSRQLNISSFVQGTTVNYTIMPDLAGVQPLKEADIISLDTISSISVETPDIPIMRGVFMHEGPVQSWDSVTLAKRALTGLGSFLDPDVKTGELLELPEPAWLMQEATVNAPAAQQLQQIYTVDSALQNPNGVPANHAYSASQRAYKKQVADAFCKHMYYFTKYQGRQMTAYGALHVNATPGKCYYIQYAKNAEKSVAFLQGMRIDVAIGPETLVQTSYQFSHMRSLTESAMTINNMPLYAL